MEDDFRGTIETNPEMRKIWIELGTGKTTSIDYFLPLSNPDQTSEERTFEEHIKMRADDVNEGFEDEERGQLRKSRVEVAENYEERIDNAKGKLAALFDTLLFFSSIHQYLRISNLTFISNLDQSFRSKRSLISGVS